MKMNIIASFFSGLLFICMIASCNEGSDPEPEVKFPEGSFDYSLITEHPRLLMNNERKEEVAALISGSEELSAIHDYIIANCNQMVALSELEYVKTGKRLLSVSREALRRIFYLSYGYRMTGSQRYLVKAKAELNAVCNFSDWNPSHYLDVGEMCMAVAIGYDWLYNELNDDAKATIRNAILNYAFKSSKVAGYNWFYDSANNWNQVCNAGLVYGALAIFEDADTACVEIIEKTLKTNPAALTCYAPNGNYPEGAMYWAYGSSFQVMLLAALESALGDDQGLSETEGFLSSAEYMLYMSGASGLRFNYSDCSNNTGPKPAMFWFAKKMENPSILYEEVKLIKEGKYVEAFEEERLLPLALIYGQKVDESRLTIPSAKVWHGEGKTPVVMVRTNWNGTSGNYLGIKAGKASESHAHMDAGSFVYETDGIRWAEDLGMQSYTAVENAGVDLWNMGQKSERWDVFRLNNKNHNTLTVDDQRHNVDGEATIEEVYDSSEKMGAKLNLTQALNLTNKLNRAIRTVSLENEEYLKVADELETKNDSVKVYWNMVTSATTELIDNRTIKLTKAGKSLLLEFLSENEFQLETGRSTKPATTYESSNSGKTMIGFTSVIPPNSSAVFAVTFKEEN